MKDGVGCGANKSTDAAHLAATRAFAERLNALMRETRTSCRALARALGVSRQAVQCWMRGANMPCGKRLRQVAAFFGVSEDCMTGVYTPRKKGGQKSREEPPKEDPLIGELFDGEEDGGEPASVCVRTWLSAEQKARLDAWCKERGLTLSAAIREAVNVLLDGAPHGPAAVRLSERVTVLLEQLASLSGKGVDAEVARIIEEGVLKECRSLGLYLRNMIGKMPFEEEVR